MRSENIVRTSSKLITAAYGKNVKVQRVKGSKVEKGSPLTVPNKEALLDVYGKEEVERQKHAEKQRRQQMRLKGKEPTKVLTKQEQRAIGTATMLDLAFETRNLAIEIMNKKLVMLNEDPEQLKKASAKELAMVFGILYDKAALASGMSTENISLHAKIDINMSSDTALEELNKMREKYQEKNNE